MIITSRFIVSCDVMLTLDCHQLPEHCVLARILRAQQLNDLNFEHIASLHSQLSKCFDDDPHLRFVQAHVLLFVRQLLQLHL